MPNLVDVSRTAELFATFFNNPVVVCFVGAIFCAYLLVVVWARRKDIQDSAKVTFEKKKTSVYMPLLKCQVLVKKSLREQPNFIWGDQRHFKW